MHPLDAGGAPPVRPGGLTARLLGGRTAVLALGVLVAALAVPMTTATTATAPPPRPTTSAADGGSGHESGLAPHRIVLWGDSLAWEARNSFSQEMRQAGANVITRTFGGTAPCDWLGDITAQLRLWRPTGAVLAFSGNTVSACMRGRDVLTAYRADVAAAVDALTAAGVDVHLVDAPARPDQPVNADGMTPLAGLWRELAAHRDGGVAVVPAALAVTAGGHWARYLPCARGEPCESRRPGLPAGPAGPPAPGSGAAVATDATGGRTEAAKVARGATATAGPGWVMVRGPDGVHFCPVDTAPMQPCPVRSAGAERYGAAMAAPFTRRAGA
ncbi:hypothetical protein AB1484_12130 [Parafrankia sp. FMc6]|uniref:hypothetical protein n=1 Tax=Parafrankia soli TaxID=2599596 RepID=UPI0034D4E38D